MIETVRDIGATSYHRWVRSRKVTCHHLGGLRLILRPRATFPQAQRSPTPTPTVWLKRKSPALGHWCPERIGTHGGVCSLLILLSLVRDILHCLSLSRVSFIGISFISRVCLLRIIVRQSALQPSSVALEGLASPSAGGKAVGFPSQTWHNTAARSPPRA